MLVSLAAGIEYPECATNLYYENAFLSLFIDEGNADICYELFYPGSKILDPNDKNPPVVDHKSVTK
jgi:hypothetical protein